MNKRPKKKKSTLYILFTGLCMVLVLVCIYRIYQQLQNYHASNQLYSDLNSTFVTTPDNQKTGNDIPETNANEIPDDSESETTGDDTFSDTDLIQVDFEALKKQNPDIIGWIYFENEDLSYPILYSGDDSTYLHTASDGSYATAGSIFEEGACSPDLNDAYTIIYGHNMRNLSMFGKLKYYYRQENYYKDHQYFQIATEEGTWRYQIFAYEIIDTSNVVYTTGFAHDEAFTLFLNKIKAQSLIHPDIEVTEEDTVVTLSTCTSGDGRFVIHGVRLD